MKSSFKLIPLGALLAFGAACVSAQTPSTAPVNPTSTPSAVGVTQQEAAEANQKAVPRSDVGTVVRTSPTAEEKAKAAMSNDTMSTTQTPAPAPAKKRMPRADRN